VSEPANQHVDPRRAPAGRARPLDVAPTHFVNGNPIKPPFPEGLEQALFAMGCFWGAERRFWETPGVYATAAGYAGGLTPNPTYEEVCTGRTGHTEVVLVVFDGAHVDYASLLKLFWESHNPTHGMRQGADVGTQYRSAVFTNGDLQHELALASRDSYQAALSASGHGPITTQVLAAPAFYYAETYHQQYLAKNPSGYCGLGGTGISCPSAR